MCEILCCTLFVSLPNSDRKTIASQPHPSSTHPFISLILIVNLFLSLSFIPLLSLSMGWCLSLSFPSSLCLCAGVSPSLSPGLPSHCWTALYQTSTRSAQWRTGWLPSRWASTGTTSSTQASPPCSWWRKLPPSEFTSKGHFSSFSESNFLLQFNKQTCKHFILNPSRFVERKLLLYFN